MKSACLKSAAAVVLGVWLLSAAGAGRADAQPQASSGEATEKLLKGIKGVEYKKVREGVLRVTAKTKNGELVVIMEEYKAPWKSDTGADVHFVYFYTEVLSFPAGFKPPTAMYAKLNEWNDRARFGNASLTKTQDGFSLVRNGSLFLRGADTDQMLDQLLLLDGEKVALQKEFRGFLEEK